MNNMSHTQSTELGKITLDSVVYSLPTNPDGDIVLSVMEAKNMLQSYAQTKVDEALREADKKVSKILLEIMLHNDNLKFPNNRNEYERGNNDAVQNMKVKIQDTLQALNPTTK